MSGVEPPAHPVAFRRFRCSWPAPRAAKFRQAAFVYLHVAILYEAAAYSMLRADMLPVRFGPPWWFLIAGAVLAAVIVWGLYSWQSQWFARVVWILHGLRLPALVNGAFFAGADGRNPPAFYITAIVVVVVNLWMLARAGWDL